MALYTAGDVDGMAALCSPDSLLDYIATGRSGQGKIHEVGVPMWRTFVAHFDGFRPEVVEVWEDTAKNTAFVATINRGIQRKDVSGIPSSGGEMAAPHLFILALGGDGRIAKITAYFDYLTMYRQLGFPTGFAKQIGAR